MSAAMGGLSEPGQSEGRGLKSLGSGIGGDGGGSMLGGAAVLVDRTR
jgi:hypothetical protein